MPPYYYTLWSEYGRFTNEEFRKELRAKIRRTSEYIEVWVEYLKTHPIDERAIFVVRGE